MYGARTGGEPRDIAFDRRCVLENQENVRQGNRSRQMHCSVDGAKHENLGQKDRSASNRR